MPATIKALLHLLTIFGISLITSSQAVANPTKDTVVLSGTLIPKETNQNIPGYIIAHYTDLFQFKRQVAGDSVDASGKFHFKFALTNPEEILLSFGDKLIAVYAFPGDSLSLTISFPPNVIIDDRKDIDINFSGTHADLNRELNRYGVLRRDAFSFEKTDSLKKTDSLLAFKKHRLELLNEDLKFCEKYAIDNKCSDTFYNIVSSYFKFKAGCDLLGYGIRTPIVPLDEEYLDFLKIINPNIAGPPLTEWYANFIIDLYIAPIDTYFKNQRHIISFTEKLEKLIAWGTKFSERDSLLINDIFEHAGQKNYDYRMDSVAIAELFSKYRIQFRKASLGLWFSREMEAATLSLNLVRSMCSSGLGTDMILLKMCNAKQDKGISISKEELKELDSQIQNKDIFARIRELNNPARPKYQNDVRLKRFVSQLNTDLVYIDFWATWCAPCKAEMKFSKRMEESYKNKNITFVYLCVDSKEADWEKLIKENKLAGVHYFLSKSEFGELSTAYQISGVPRYMLVTKEAKIIDGDMSRPSQESETILKIERALKDLKKFQ
ncbi:TlpA family protein disulfide reductase [Pinibacter soli]|uniref:TlpA disulfide reductase family protein n=1 Tax=Pinibacter soli TaxID=3044211 RepID=A0ABT6R9J4_9BACT|nr:TlpA disulfide reductase family protein [Pinibacter soli]MDI3319233.1 TlpA disulfide reductase family protein [Pinibacter soli]